MKKSLVFAAFLTLSFFAPVEMNAQSGKNVGTKAPSDAPSGYTYDFDKTRTLLVDYQINPGKQNADVAELVKSKDFPKLQKNQSADAAYYDKVRIWMEANPNKIITTLKHREDIVRPF
jgi:hypothetical protein